MKLYLDTFDLAAWHEWMPTKLFYGITTNPILAKKAGLTYSDIDWKSTINQAAILRANELHIQLPSSDEQSVDFASQIWTYAKNYRIKIVIKIPLTTEGILLAPKIKALELPILMTACYHSKQYITAAILEADYIAPYFGRMIENGIDATHHLSQMRAMAEKNTLRCKILVASLRTINQMIDLATDGHNHFTISPDLAKELVIDKTTDTIASEFAEIASKGTRK